MSAATKTGHGADRRRWKRHSSKTSLIPTIQKDTRGLVEFVDLISREGEKITLHKDLLKRASAFFVAALENGMSESGEKRVHDGPRVHACIEDPLPVHVPILFSLSLSLSLSLSFSLFLSFSLPYEI
jgi:hypothetical protein